MSFLSSLRSVIILSDEGVHVYSRSNTRTKYLDSIPWETEGFEEAVANCLVKQGRRKPVVILNGMVEQHYRKEKIPKVSAMDRANVIKRRLGVAFPNYPIRAALKLNKETNTGGTTSYLFAAMPSGDSFNKVINAAVKSKVTIVGVYLLPVEAAPLVQKLTSKLYSNEESRATWTIIVGQHRGGGLRQVVTRKGELALTRMSPVVDTDIEPELWAGEVYGEIKATMSYLSRFGYVPEDGLNIIVIANEQCNDSLEKLVDINCNLSMLNAQEAAKAAGLRLGRQDDLRYADTLYASFLGGRSRFILPMEAPAISRMVKPRRVASFLIMGLLVGCLGVAWLLSQSFSERFKISEELKVSRDQKNSLEQEYQREVDRKKDIGFDFVYVNNSIQLYDKYNSEKAHVLKVVREIARSLGVDLRIDKIQMDVVERKKKPVNPYAYPGQSGEDIDVERDIKTVMTLSFSQDVEPDVGVGLVNDLRDRLKTNLPSHQVEIAKQVAGLSYTGNFAGEAVDEELESIEEQELKAEIVIVGAVQ